MNHIDQSLDRLLKNAALAPAPEPDSLPSRLEARVMAQWRRAPVDDLAGWLPMYFRRAIICAGLVMLSSVGWGALQKSNAVPGSTALANLNNTLQVLPWVK